MAVAVDRHSLGTGQPALHSTPHSTAHDPVVGAEAETFFHRSSTGVERLIGITPSKTTSVSPRDCAPVTDVESPPGTTLLNARPYRFTVVESQQRDRPSLSWRAFPTSFIHA